MMTMMLIMMVKPVWLGNDDDGDDDGDDDNGKTCVGWK